MEQYEYESSRIIHKAGDAVATGHVYSASGLVELEEVDDDEDSDQHDHP